MRVQLPGLPPITSVGGILTIALVVASLITMAASLGAWVMFSPEAVLTRFTVWTPLTYMVVAGSPMGVIFGALILWGTGGNIEQVWGRQRLIWFSVCVPLLAAIGTLLLGLAVPSIRMMTYSGAEVLVTAYWIGWGLHCGPRQTGFWGLPVNGYIFALIGVGFIVLNAAYSSWLLVVPDALGAAVTFLFIRVGSPLDLWTRIQSSRLQRDLKKRSSHLKVMSNDRNTGGGSDRYLH